MAGGFQAGAFQQDAFDTTIEFVIEVNEAKDTASFSVSAVTPASFNASEASDTASASLTATTPIAVYATEAPDIPSFTATSKTIGWFTAQEGSDTASIRLRAQNARFIAFNATEAGVDTVSVELSARNIIAFDATEAGIDTASVELLSRNIIALDATEQQDTAFIRTFAFDTEDGDAYVILVPPEIQSVTLPPAYNHGRVSDKVLPAHVPDEWQRVDVDQMRASRQKG